MTTVKHGARAVFCTRVSTFDQETEHQRLELHRYAEARGWSVREFVDRGISSARERWSSLDALLKGARRRQFDVLVVWRLDRLGHNLRHLVNNPGGARGARHRFRIPERGNRHHNACWLHPLALGASR